MADPSGSRRWHSPLVWGCWVALAGCAPPGRVEAGGGSAAGHEPLIVADSTRAREVGVERLRGQFLIAGIVAGQVTIAIQWCDTPSGRVVVDSEGRSSQLVSLVQASRGTLRSELEPQSLLPERHTATALRGDGEVHREGIFMPGFYERVSRVGDEPPKVEQALVPGHARAHDLHSALLLMRRWRAHRGQGAMFFVVMSRWVWRVEVQALGAGVVMMDAGPRTAEHFSGTATRLGGDEPRQDGFEFWFSDDADRVPLRLLVHTGGLEAWLDLDEREWLPEGCPAPPVQQPDATAP